MSKHTPGPWVVRYDYVVQAPAYEDGRLVPVAQPYGVNCDGTDLFANARLIAAAPELLEAIRGVIEHMEWSTDQGEAAYQFARAAIAKATGEA